MSKYRKPKEIKDDILEYFCESKQWYMENILRDHVADILKSASMNTDIDICDVVVDDGNTVPLDWFVEILYERIMQNVENVVASTEEVKEMRI